MNVAEPRVAFDVSPDVMPAPHRWTVHDVRAMVAAGIIDKNAPLELIDGVTLSDYDAPPPFTADARSTVC